MDRSRDGNPVEVFLVERYWPDVDVDELRRALPRLESAVTAMRSEGRQVEYIGSILMPIDQVVFTLVAAADEREISELNERAALPVDRIAKAIALLGPAMTGGPAGRRGPEVHR